MLGRLLKREIQIGLRQRADIGMLMVFTLLCTLLFVMGVGSRGDMLVHVSSGILWLIFIFATQLMASFVWRSDLEDGTLQQFSLFKIPLETLIISKALMILIFYHGI